MKKLLLCIACLAAMSATAQKIDFDAAGKVGDAKHTEQGFWGWDVARAASDTLPKYDENGEAVYRMKNSVDGEKLPDGMQLVVTNASYDAATAADGYYGVAGTWGGGKKVESNPLSKIPDDFVCTTWIDSEKNMQAPEEFTALRLIIKGMKPGAHTLLSYHSASNHSSEVAMVKVQVDGVDACEPVQISTFDGTNWQGVDDIAQTFVSFTVEEGKDVVIDYVPVPAEGVEYTNKRVYLNGIVFDAVDPNMKVTNMWPNNNNLHLDAPDNSVTMTWVGSPSAASHRVMFGTSADNMQEVQNTSAESYTATGLTPLYTYYWRVDEVPAAGEPVEGDVFTFRINQLAFPGAEGFGRYAYGGRGGQVVHVTSLEDDGSEGTLRWALETVTGPRTVVFDVSGIITISKRISVNEPYVTIAGQTAPGDGIMVRGQQISLHSEGITRFIRLRLGSVINDDKGTGYSCVDLQGKTHSIVDHASVEWGTAETFKAAGNYTGSLTVQNTIISEALTNGNPGVDGFGYGFEAGGEYGSYHHNLMANNYMNSPRIAGGQDASMKWLGEEEYYNNVAYNWQGSAANGSASKVNFVGNYYKAGPATNPEVSSLMSINVPKNGSGTIDYYISGNVLDVNGTLTNDPYSISLVKDEETGEVAVDAYQPNISGSPVVENGAVYESAAVAYARVLSEVGASLKRDATDKRIVANVFNGTTTEGDNGMIASIEESDYDVYEQVTRESDFDTNQNGIADWFEKLTGKTEANADDDGDGYTNLEDYLNFIAAPYAVVTDAAPATFDLSELFAGLRNPQFAVEGVAGQVEGSTLTVSRGAQSEGIYQAVVTATSGDTSISRTLNICLSGEASGIMPTQLKEARVQSFQLFNAAGIMLLQGDGNGAAPSQLNLSGVPAGVYLMKVVDQDGRTRTYSVLMR